MSPHALTFASDDIKNDLQLLGSMPLCLHKHMDELGMECFIQDKNFSIVRDSLLNINVKIESDEFIIRNYGQEEELSTQIKKLLDSSGNTENNKSSNESVSFSSKRRSCYDNEDSMHVSVNFDDTKSCKYSFP